MPLADELLNESAGTDLVTHLAEVSPESDFSHVTSTVRSMGSLGLSERARALAVALVVDGPDSFEAFVAMVRRALEQPSFRGWMIWPVGEAVATKAVNDGSKESFVGAMELLAALTPRLTAEFAIRQLLRHDMAGAMEIVLTWVHDPDPHVRRLASEGTRPFLPWAARVQPILTHPETTVPVLEALYRDESDYVRRSVANHLNDLSRQNPDMVVAIAGRWMKAPDRNTIRVVRHGLRTLIKRGDPEALAVLGYTPSKDLLVTVPSVESDRISMGQSLVFTSTITNNGRTPAQVMIDYVVHHVKSNGTTTPKTFKLRTAVLAPGQSMQVHRDHAFRTLTTRRYYPGTHSIALQVNGVLTEASSFSLLQE